MPIQLSVESLIQSNPRKYALAEPTKLLTKIKGEPPMNSGKGRRRNPIITAIYNELITNRNEWFHVNIPVTSKQQLASLRASLSSRALKDNLTLSTTSLFNEATKMFDLWIILS
jgi:hypothetical protein